MDEVIATITVDYVLSAVSIVLDFQPGIVAPAPAPVQQPDDVSLDNVDTGFTRLD